MTTTITASQYHYAAVKLRSGKYSAVCAEYPGLDGYGPTAIHARDDAMRAVNQHIMLLTTRGESPVSPISLDTIDWSQIVTDADVVDIEPNPADVRTTFGTGAQKDRKAAQPSLIPPNAMLDVPYPSPRMNPGASQGSSVTGEPANNPATDVLHEAAGIVNGERQGTYGPPEDSFNRIAAYWTTYLGREVSAADVAIMMALLKIARRDHDRKHRDSYVDGAAYMALGYQISAH